MKKGPSSILQHLLNDMLIIKLIRLSINIVEDFLLLSKVGIMLGTEHGPLVRFRNVNDV